MMTVLFAAAYIAVCLKWGAWRRWREYYPTILFLIIGDLTVNFALYNYTLWKYNTLINHTLTDLLICITVFPSAVILFLSHYPKGRLRQLMYILIWSAVNTLFELIAVLTGAFGYENGWNISWSFGVFFIGFTLVRLHDRHPIAVWPISALLAGVVMMIFQIPIGVMK